GGRTDAVTAEAIGAAVRRHARRYVSWRCRRGRELAGVTGMTPPFIAVMPLSDSDYAAFRRQAIFECFKWDPQIGDANVVARHPLVLRRKAWEDVVPLAEGLAREALAAEAELVRRPQLHSRLGLPRAVRRALAAGQRRWGAFGRRPHRPVRFSLHRGRVAD